MSIYVGVEDGSLIRISTWVVSSTIAIDKHILRPPRQSLEPCSTSSSVKKLVTVVVGWTFMTLAAAQALSNVVTVIRPDGQAKHFTTAELHALPREPVSATSRPPTPEALSVRCFAPPAWNRRTKFVGLYCVAPPSCKQPTAMRLCSPLRYSTPRSVRADRGLEEPCVRLPNERSMHTEASTCVAHSAEEFCCQRSGKKKRVSPL